jgi:hypothetical protein
LGLTAGRGHAARKSCRSGNGGGVRREAPASGKKRLNQLYHVRKTLFIRCLDNMPEVLVASALADSDQRGVTPICVFLSYSADAETLRVLLADPRIESVGCKDNPAQNLLPSDLQDNPRVGRYWEPGAWSLPACRCMFIS